MRKKMMDGLRATPYFKSPAHLRNVARALQMRPPPSAETLEKMRLARLKRRMPTRLTSIEQALMKELKKRRVKFDMHKLMFGRWWPDFVMEDAKLIVQADGDYWHAREDVVQRDGEFNKQAAEHGWTVWRFSEAAIKHDAARCAQAIAKFVKHASHPSLPLTMHVRKRK